MKNTTNAKNKSFYLIWICIAAIAFLALSFHKYLQQNWEQQQYDCLTFSDLEHIFTDLEDMLTPLQNKIKKQELLIDNLMKNCYCCDHKDNEEDEKRFVDDDDFDFDYGYEEENYDDEKNEQIFETDFTINVNEENVRQLRSRRNNPTTTVSNIFLRTSRQYGGKKSINGSSGKKSSKKQSHRSSLSSNDHPKTDPPTTTNPSTIPPTEEQDLLTRIEELEYKTQCMTNYSNKFGVYFSGCNVHINNGEDESITANSYGNLLIGHYNNETTLVSSSTTTSRRDLVEVHDTGCSHNIILGIENACTSDSYGGIVGGKNNTLAGAYTSVLGGENNLASGDSSTITGGKSNKVEGKDSSILGGNNNTVSGEISSISGGEHNTAASTCSSIIGGHDEVTTSHTEIEPSDDKFNAIADKLACVRDGSSAAEFVFEGCNVLIQNNQNSTEIIDGTGNLIVGHNEGTGTRNGSHNIIVGSNHEYTSYGGFVAGTENTISGRYASVSGGRNNKASGTFSSILGGFDNQVMGEGTCVSGGRGNIATNMCASISGGENNYATERYASVSGGYEGVAGGNWSSVLGGNTSKTNEEYGIAPLICVGCKEIDCDDGDLCTIDEIIQFDFESICKHTFKSCPLGESCDPNDGECKKDDDLVPCVAVIDEDDAFANPAAKWTEFRTKYATRPFCLLRVQPPGSKDGVTIPPDFKSDGNTLTFNITKDYGNEADATDWTNLCGLDGYTSSNVGFVGLFVDDSGSMKKVQVNASYNKFINDMDTQGIEVRIVVDTDENWILPFMTDLTLSV